MNVLRVLFIIITTVLFAFAVRSIVKAATFKPSTGASGAHRVAGLVAIPVGAAISVLLSTWIFA